MIPRFHLNSFFALLFLTACLTTTQNCSNVGFHNSQSSNESSTQKSGDSYDGKPEPGDYYRVVPDYKCANTPEIPEIVSVSPGRMTLSSLDANCARQTRNLSVSEIKGANYNRAFIAVGSGAFEKMKSRPDVTDHELKSLELWCHHAEEPFGVDVAVRIRPSSNTGDALLFYTEADASGVYQPKTESRALVTRRLEASKLTYSSSDFKLDVDLSNLNAGTYSAILNTTLGGKSLSSDVLCRSAGRFDSLAPVPALSCPAGYVNLAVIGNPVCMAKYEAKNVGGVVASNAAGLPWTNVSRNQALTNCQALGPSYDLTTNAEFQSVARSLEANPFNWSGGVIGSPGGMSRGHSDNAPATTLAADVDSSPCSGTGQACDLSTWNSQRRVLQTAQNEYIWDLAGNADEWLKDDITRGYGPMAQTSQITNGGAYDAQAKDLFGPAGNYLSLNSAPFAGLGLSFLDATGGALRRGGGWQFNGTDYGGLFNAYLYDAPTATDPSIGFRCVFHP